MSTREKDKYGKLCGPQKYIFYYLHWGRFSLFNVLFHKMFVVGVTGLSRKDRRKYEDWKAQSLGGKVGVKIFLMIFI